LPAIHPEKTNTFTCINVVAELSPIDGSPEADLVVVVLPTVYVQ
jgi:hypothetical protein